MIIGIQGTRSFSDYPVLLRAMGTALYGMSQDDKEILIYSAGPANINDLVLEFSNVSEKGLKARGIKIKMMRVPASWIESNINVINYFVFLSKPGERNSHLVDVAEAQDIEVGIYRY